MNLFTTMPADRLLTQAEVAEILVVSTRQVRRLVQHDRIPYVRVAGLVRFDPASLEAWLEAGSVDLRS